MLEHMLHTCDNMKIKDAWIIEYQGKCIQQLVDSINETLNRLLKSKTTLSCRNVLVANFETMTKTAYWLKCKLFVDLPKAMGKALREKIEQMVDLLKDLMVKIINVDEFAEEFLERLKNRYLKKRHTSDYELWKARQSKITIKRLVRYQVDLTAEMLSCGILKYAEAPNGEEIQNVDKDKLALTLTDKSKITETFINECAKLRRYSHWEDDMFVIDYQLLRKYLYCMFGKLTSEQHIKMFEYDVQMKQIHEDMRKLMKEHEEDELKEEKEMKDVIAGTQFGTIGRKKLNLLKLARAIENCQKFFWGNSSYGVVFCLCRDDYGMEPNKSAFENMMGNLPNTKKLSYICTENTIATAFSNNPIFNENINNWDGKNPMARIIKLRDELRKQLNS